MIDYGRSGEESIQAVYGGDVMGLSIVMQLREFAQNPREFHRAEPGAIEGGNYIIFVRVIADLILTLMVSIATCDES